MVTLKYKYYQHRYLVYTQIVLAWLSRSCIFQHLLCDTLTSSATFHTPEVTKQSWKLRCPVQKHLVIRTKTYTKASENKENHYNGNTWDYLNKREILRPVSINGTMLNLHRVWTDKGRVCVCMFAYHWAVVWCLCLPVGWSYLIVQILQRNSKREERVEKDKCLGSSLNTKTVTKILLSEQSHAESQVCVFAAKSIIFETRDKIKWTCSMCRGVV